VSHHWCVLAAKCRKRESVWAMIWRNLTILTGFTCHWPALRQLIGQQNVFKI